MPESNRDTNLQKGARVINAAIAELELPDEVKVSAQQVVTMFATDLLPGLWVRGAAPPTPPAPEPDPAAATPADEADLLASLRREIATLTDTDDEDEISMSSVPTPRPDRRPRGRAAAKSPRAAATPREPAPLPWDESETKIVEAALVTLRYAYLSQISRFEAAVLSASNRRADSMDVLELLLGAQEYHRADPALRALQALSPPAAKSDRH
jgi:hypothetical protein